MTKILYSTRATATGGRDGHARTDDGAFDVALGTPKELGGNGAGNDPEQLFAAGNSACFLSAMKFVASQGGHAKVPSNASVIATVGITPQPERGCPSRRFRKPSGRAGIRVQSVAADEVSGISAPWTLVSLDTRASSAWTRARLGRQPTGPDLLSNPAAMNFAATS